MTKFATLSVLIVAALDSIAASAHIPHARLTMAQARTIALKVAPGRVVDAEYEKEGGAWRYSFDIRQGQRIHEVGVNANSGKIIENKYEALKDKD